MYDVQVSSDYNQVYDPADLPLEGYDLVTQFLAEREISVAADCTFFLYLPQAEAFVSGPVGEVPRGPVGVQPAVFALRRGAAGTYHRGGRVHHV